MIAPDLTTAIDRLRELVEESDMVVPFTGAGISTECGIPDFRSPGGLWTKTQPIPFDDFMARQDMRDEAWRRRFVMDTYFANAKPGRGHLALASLYRLGKVPAVIHLSPEALLQGPIGKVRTGDMLVIDAEAGVLDIEIEAAEWAARPNAVPLHQAANEVGFGRELFGVFRAAAAPAEQGASVFGAMVGEHSAHHGEAARRERAAGRPVALLARRALLALAGKGRAPLPPAARRGSRSLPARAPSFWWRRSARAGNDSLWTTIRCAPHRTHPAACCGIFRPHP